MTTTFIAHIYRIHSLHKGVVGGHAEDSRTRIKLCMTFPAMSKGKSEEVFSKAAPEQGMNGVAGQGVDGGSSVLDSTQSHH